MKVSNEVIIEQRPKEREGERHSDIWEKNILSRGKCKGPEAAEGEREWRKERWSGSKGARSSAS